MAQIRIHKDSLVIELTDLEKVEALHGDLLPARSALT